MRHSSDWKANALILLAALGLAALYGGVTGLVLWALDFSDAAEIGGIVSTVTGGLALIVALFAIIYFGDDYIEKPAHWIALPFIALACCVLFILILPPIILTLGYFWRWLFDTGTPKNEGI